MQPFKRHCVLIADSPDCALGEVAVRLTRLGIDPLYTNDLDEALLLAVQESERVGAIAFPVSLPLIDLDRTIKLVATRAGVGPNSLIPIGPAADAERVLALRERNIRWAVWEPFQDADLRFVLSNVLLQNARGEVRLEPRIPGHGVRARLYKDEVGSAVDVVDLSMGGVFLATDRPLPEQSEVTLELEVDAHALRMRGNVRWVRENYGGERDDMRVGMGVEFEEAGAALGRDLRRFVQSRISRYVVTAAPPPL
jgi:Tfp pilus assembly protein PilZ